MSRRSESSRSLVLAASDPNLTPEARCKILRESPELRAQLTEGSPELLQRYLACLVSAGDLAGLEKEIDSGLVNAAAAATLLTESLLQGFDGALVSLISARFKLSPQETDEMLDKIVSELFHTGWKTSPVSTETATVLAKSVPMSAKQHATLLWIMNVGADSELAPLNAKIPDLDLNAVDIDRAKYPLLWQYRAKAFPPSEDEEPQRVLSADELQQYETTLRRLAWFADAFAQMYGESEASWFSAASGSSQRNAIEYAHIPFPGEKQYNRLMKYGPGLLLLHHPMLLKAYRELIKF